jgi:hypothetical protein
VFQHCQKTPPPSTYGSGPILFVGGIKPVISMGVACSPRKFATESLSVASDRHRTAQVATSETAIMNATTAFTRLGGPGDSTGGSGATSRIGWPLHSKHRAQLKKAPRESPAAVWEETPLIRGNWSSVLPDSAQLQHGNRGHSLRSRAGNGCRGSSTTEPKSGMIAERLKAAWNSNCDNQAFVHEDCQHFYADGPSAPI